jgi:microsomal dipeptidase-like Zn-dependent dipeptidase
MPPETRTPVALDELDFFADIHLHPTTKAMLLKGVESPWQDVDEAEAEARRVRNARITRSDFQKLFRGNVRLAGAYLIVPERYIYSKLMTSPGVIARYFGMDLPNARDILNKTPFELLKRELAFLKKHLKDAETGREAVIVQDYAHLEATLQHPNKLALVLGIEGAHNLGFEYHGPDFPVEGKLYNFKNRVQPAEDPTYDLAAERVAWMKKNHIHWFTINHFVYNHLATMPKAAELTGWKKIGHNPFRSLHLAGSYRGLTHLGHCVVEECLRQGIFLDLKHADAATRHQVYYLARRYGRPVVASHIGVSGRETNLKGASSEMLQPEDFPADRLKSRERFNPWDINLHDYDIVAIHELGGLMGLILDERILASQAVQKDVAAGKADPYTPLFNQIEHIYKTLRKAGVPAPECLDSVCMGSDFDGFIEPIQHVVTAADYRPQAPEGPKPSARPLEQALVEYFRTHPKYAKETKLEPEEMARKVLRTNVLRFLKKWWV